MTERIGGRIYQVGDGKTFLEPSELRSLPSVVAEHEAPRTSNKYKFFSSLGIADLLETQKWLPVLAQEQLVRTESRKGFQKHMIRFRRPDVIMQNVGDLAPEIILTNSHDGLSAYHLMVGIFRLACLNGMVVAEAHFGTIKLRHMGFEEKDVIDATFKVIEDVPKLTDKVQQYRKIELKPDERFTFAELALDMKFGAEDGETKREGADYVIGDRKFNLPTLLAPKRKDDMENTLWTTFNVIQEKLIKGNEFERTVRMSDTGRLIKKTKVAGIRGIDESLRVNRGLWELVDIFAEMRASA